MSSLRSTLQPTPMSPSAATSMLTQAPDYSTATSADVTRTGDDAALTSPLIDASDSMLSLLNANLSTTTFEHAPLLRIASSDSDSFSIAYDAASILKSPFTHITQTRGRGVTLDAALKGGEHASIGGASFTRCRCSDGGHATALLSSLMLPSPDDAENILPALSKLAHLSFEECARSGVCVRCVDATASVTPSLLTLSDSAPISFAGTTRTPCAELYEHHSECML